jgi:hypothetical protein
VNEQARIIIIQTALPLRAPRDKLTHMAEFVARANQHIVQGSLGVSFHSGIVAFQASVILGKSDCQPDLFYHLLASNSWEMKRWFPATKAVILDGLSPEDATNMIVRQHQPDEHGRNSGGDFGRQLSDIQRGSVN